MDVLNGYRDSHDVSSDDDSEDSDKECTVWKRAPAKRAVEEEISASPPKEELKEIPVQMKRKRNTIWSEVLTDQLISEDLEDCLLKNKPRNFGSRGKESYDYTLKYGDSRSERDSDSHMSDIAFNEEPRKSKVKHTAPFRNNVKKFVKLSGAENTASLKINKILNERKYYLIQRIVKTVGIEKSMALLNMTQEIEANGGMMTQNNTRRRTPGGVYIQLLKSDKSVTKEMLDKIFEGEMSGIELKRYLAEQRRNKKQKRKAKMQKSNESKLMSEVNEEPKESSEVVPMDAEITSDLNSENLGVGNAISLPTSIFNKSASENNSDLEEGEIED